MRTLITGGAGFIGSHLADALLDRGDQVTILDDLSTGSLENLSGALDAGATLVEGSILDAELVDEAVSKAQPEVLFHLAAQGEVQRSIKEPAFDAEVNVLGIINVIEAGRRSKLDRLVFASTGGAIYGEGSDLELPANETVPALPLCPYGQSKLAGEHYLALYQRMYGLESVALRFANVYGPRQNPKGESGAVAIFSELLLDGERPVVFGDGQQTRDFVYIEDIVRAILAASEPSMEGPINLGTGVETSLLSLLSTLDEAGRRLELGVRSADLDFSPVFDSPRGGEVRRISIDPTRAAELLGWSAEVTLIEGLYRTLKSIADSSSPD